MQFLFLFLFLFVQSTFGKALLHKGFRELGGDIDRYIDRYIEQDIDRYKHCLFCTPSKGGHLEQATP